MLEVKLTKIPPPNNRGYKQYKRGVMQIINRSGTADFAIRIKKRRSWGGKTWKNHYIQNVPFLQNKNPWHITFLCLCHAIGFEKAEEILYFAKSQDSFQGK